MTWSLLNLFMVLSILQNPGVEAPHESGITYGEFMQYKLRYSIFQVGVATVACHKNQSGEIYHIRVDARSNGLVKLFNKMIYYLECYVDPTTGLPDSAFIDLNDRKHSLYNELRFDQEARPDSAMVKSNLSGDHIVSRNIYEMLTGFYYFRKDLIMEEPYPGHEVAIQTFYPDNPWELKFVYAGEEMIKSAVGEQLCFTYHPGTIAGKFFEREDAMTVWFTKVEPHIPVRFHLDLKIGALHGILVEYSD